MVQPFLPNEADAFNANQAEPDSVDFEILLLGYQRTGVDSGCAVTESSPAAQTIDVAVGVVALNGSQIAVTAQPDEAVSAADGTNPRIDLISINSSGSVVVTAGTAAAQPVAPAIPATSIPLAFLYVPTSDNTHADDQINDKRVLLDSEPDVGIRYVATTGDNDNDGLSWQTAFLTIEAAIADLPTAGSGGTLHHFGRIFIGDGLFTENNPLEVNSTIQFIGVGTDFGSQGGTEIKGSNNAHLFAPTGAYADFAHYVWFKDLLLNGAGIVGSFDLLRLNKGGANCRVEDVHFRNSPRHGLYMIDNAVTTLVVDCMWVFIEGDCIYFLMNGAIDNLQIIHAQADEVTGYFLNVEHVTGAQGSMIMVDGAKVESTTAGDFDRVINFKPRTSAGGNPPYFRIANLTAAQNDGGGGTTVVHEEAGSGVAAHWFLSNINGQGYTNGFDSVKTGQTSLDAGIRQAVFGQIESFNFDSPPHEIAGLALDVDTGTPETNLSRPVASLYLRDDGALGTSLYYKASGTGNTGWRPIDTGAIEEAGAVTLDWEDAVVNMDSSGGTRVVTLPDNAAFDGKSYLIRRDGSNTVTIDRAGSDTFDDADIQKTLDSDSAAIGIFSIGDGEWKIVATEGTVGGS